MMTGELPIDKFAAKGPSVVTAGEGTKSSAKSVCKIIYHISFHNLIYFYLFIILIIYF
jgi:hypothetical protein